jgi:tetratricopeptide (TPR) repeat protein
MLETIREFAAEQLQASGEEESARRRHLRYLIDLADEAGPHLEGPEQDAWLDRVERERENIRAAERLAAERGDVEGCLRLAAPLWRYWQTRAGANDARERLDIVLRLAPLAPPTPESVKALSGLGLMARVLGDYASAQSLFERCLALARQMGDPGSEALSLSKLSILAGYMGDYERGRRLSAEGLAIRDVHPEIEGISDALREAGMIEFLDNQPDDARAFFERAILAGEEVGDQRAVANASYSLGLIHHLLEELPEARRMYSVCLETDRAQGHRASEGSNLCNLGHVAVLEGNTRDARTFLRESLLASHDGGDRRRIAFTLSVVACLMVLEGVFEPALRLDAAALAVLDTMNAPLAPAMREKYDTQLGVAADVLGPAGAATARTLGRALSLDQARHEALAWLAASPETDVASDEAGFSDAPTTRIVVSRS